MTARENWVLRLGQWLDQRDNRQWHRISDNRYYLRRSVQIKSVDNLRTLIDFMAGEENAQSRVTIRLNDVPVEYSALSEIDEPQKKNLQIAVQYRWELEGGATQLMDCVWFDITNTRTALDAMDPPGFLHVGINPTFYGTAHSPSFDIHSLKSEIELRLRNVGRWEARKFYSVFSYRTTTEHSEWVDARKIRRTAFLISAIVTLGINALIFGAKFVFHIP